jgi:hypothetical protein
MHAHAQQPIEKEENESKYWGGGGIWVELFSRCDVVDVDVDSVGIVGDKTKTNLSCSSRVELIRVSRDDEIDIEYQVKGGWLGREKGAGSRD